MSSKRKPARGAPRQPAASRHAGGAAAAVPPAPSQIVLVTPPLGDPALFEDRIVSALDAGPVAAVILRFEPADDRTLINRLKQIAPAIQSRGAALMVAASVDVAVRGGADGVHLAFDRAGVEEAVSRLSPDRMVGVAGLRSRDDAMASGECGCDYVMFGEPAVTRRAEGEALPPFAAVVDRVAWWAELFEVPVVGYAPDLDSVKALAAVQADFIALGDAVWDHADGPAAAVSLALASIGQGAAA
ncbi:thiamine phosphate synthase [Phreatobacter sp.]|uniref:thiamine phosphate synthase n=1 Tax=Phreatobacter sp. TaxID=1966341 RepID=UPI003F6E8C70